MEGGETASLALDWCAPTGAETVVCAVGLRDDSLSTSTRARTPHLRVWQGYAISGLQ